MRVRVRKVQGGGRRQEAGGDVRVRGVCHSGYEGTGM